MKGSPPFSRKPVEKLFSTPASAGLGPAIRKALRRPILKHSHFTLASTGDEVWLVADCGEKAYLHLRLFHELRGLKEVTVAAGDRSIRVRVEGALGTYSALITWEVNDPLALRIRVTLRTKTAAKLVGMSRDLCLTDRTHEPLQDGMFTGDAAYKDLSFVCMGSILSLLWLWEPANAGKTWRTYMGLPPLHDAPYLAPYEEAEVFVASRIYLELLGEQIPPFLEDLLVEYGKHLLGRARFYFPSELPRGALAEEPKEGVIDVSLAIPLEDLCPPEEPAGQVGQEVYGAALALILCTASFHHWKKIPFTVWCEAPFETAEFEIGDKAKSGCLRFRLAGSSRHLHAVRFLRDRRSPVRLSVTVAEGDNKPKRIATAATSEGHRLIAVKGHAVVTVEWKKTGG